MDETERERLQRNFLELLQELRVAQTGVQILFAFLLTISFTPRFGSADSFTRAVYLVALLSAAVATALIVAPVAYHRTLFRMGEKEWIVFAAHRTAMGGLAFLLLAVVSSVLLATEVALSRGAAAAVAAGTAVVFAALWFIAPLVRRRSMRAEELSWSPRRTRLVRSSRMSRTGGGDGPSRASARLRSGRRAPPRRSE